MARRPRNGVVPTDAQRSKASQTLLAAYVSVLQNEGVLVADPKDKYDASPWRRPVSRRDPATIDLFPQRLPRRRKASARG